MEVNDAKKWKLVSENVNLYIVKVGEASFTMLLSVKVKFFTSLKCKSVLSESLWGLPSSLLHVIVGLGWPLALTINMLKYSSKRGKSTSCIRYSIYQEVLHFIHTWYLSPAHDMFSGHILSSFLHVSVLLSYFLRL